MKNHYGLVEMETWKVWVLCIGMLLIGVGIGSIITIELMTETNEIFGAIKSLIGK